MRGMIYPSDDVSEAYKRSFSEPMLVLDGRRSLFTSWPYGVRCETCGSDGAGEDGTGRFGYSGPVAIGDSVCSPDTAMHHTCRCCARRQLGLGPREFTGHVCQDRCTDDRHEDTRSFERSRLEAVSEPVRIDYIIADYAARGWRVLRVRPVPGALSTSGPRWTVEFVRSRCPWK